MDTPRFRWPPSNDTVTVIGRVANSSGQIIDVVLEGIADLRVTSGLEIQRLIQRPSDLTNEFLDRAERPLAFVGIGFGPAPASDFDRLLWKGEFDESKHPRMAGGSPEAGEFRSANEEAILRRRNNP